ncbi:uncharacterized protein [Palaemon carinicauda]|uniref:uncharacterized protein n=1 Tax=Palaemon carinicauda TaxID=392227 RepID=UPI0035B64FD2
MEFYYLLTGRSPFQIAQDMNFREAVREMKSINMSSPSQDHKGMEILHYSKQRNSMILATHVTEPGNPEQKTLPTKKLVEFKAPLQLIPFQGIEQETSGEIKNDENREEIYGDNNDGKNTTEHDSEGMDTTEEVITEDKNRPTDAHGKEKDRWNTLEIKDWNITKIEVDPDKSYLIKVESWNDLGQSPIAAQPVTSILEVEDSLGKPIDDQLFTIWNNIKSIPFKNLNSSCYNEEEIESVKFHNTTNIDSGYPQEDISVR